MRVQVSKQSAPFLFGRGVSDPVSTRREEIVSATTTAASQARALKEKARKLFPEVSEKLFHVTSDPTPPAATSDADLVKQFCAATDEYLKFTYVLALLNELDEAVNRYMLAEDTVEIDIS